MAFRIKPEVLHEMSIVLAKADDGTEFAPRNPEARVLAVKAKDKNIVEKAKAAFEVLKSYFAEPYVAGPGYPVSVEVADNIDNDGDGADDYNAICQAICGVASDIQQACAISDDDARSAAIVKAVDSFLDGLDDIRSDDDANKAGARHSADDLERLRKIADATTGIGTHIEALAGALKELGVTGAQGPVAGRQGPEQDGGPENSQVDDDDAEKALAAFTPGEVGEDGYPVNMADYLSLREKAKKKDEPPKPYGNVEYADPENGKYPIDTKEHAKAAWSYINMPKNAEKYSADKLAEVKSRIRAACKEFGVEISDDSGKAAEVEMTQEQLDAAIAQAASKAAEEAVAKANEANKDAVAKATSDAEAAAKAKIEEAQKAADAAKAEADESRRLLAAAAGNAPASLSAAVEAQKNGSRLFNRMKAEMAQRPESHVF